ncbi:hypothetical protein KSP39_PZI010377 [Platanthera zijinensis]|uniref:BZIP domain-containing protein n=1 Tax=Platanthera zijinensis TaxID=2320716 RepID=A0AAP0BIV4_9ASPA
MDCFLDEILKDTQHHAYTHTHSCKPPDETTVSTQKGSTKKCSCKNQEAVRKYIEKKKKAKTSSLEVEVVQLREINQQLMKRLQSQANLEAENAQVLGLMRQLDVVVGIVENVEDGSGWSKVCRPHRPPRPGRLRG